MGDTAGCEGIQDGREEPDTQSLREGGLRGPWLRLSKDGGGRGVQWLLESSQEPEGFQAGGRVHFLSVSGRGREGRGH